MTRTVQNGSGWWRWAGTPSRPLAVHALRVVVGLLVFGLSNQAVHAQESVSEVLSFLLTNRSIPTDDFLQDAQAAAATRDTISRFLLIELGTLPISSSAGGFTYRLDRALGTIVLSSDSFGPFFTERSLTAGKEQLSFGLSYQRSGFQHIDGRQLRDGTLVATASKLRNESQPFDVETLSLLVDTNTVTFTGNYGLTDRLDVSVAIPFVRLTLDGERVDTYRGRPLLQAAGSASASGLGDIVLRTKYNLVRDGGSGLAIGSEIRLPTGNEDNLLGAGDTTFQPRLIASYEDAGVAISANLGYAFRRVSDELDYAGALTLVALPRLTLVGEFLGRRLGSFGRLTEATAPHPLLAGIDTIRLTSVPTATNRMVAVAGLKWNMIGTWLVSASLLRPLTTAGLNAGWIPALTFDYSFGR